jgi:hypothetical protein
MDDLSFLFGVLIALAIFLIFVTVIGHGIWLILAAIFRALFSLPSPDPLQQLNLSSAPPAPVECVYCGAVSRATVRFCGVCGRNSPDPKLAERVAELTAARKQFERWAGAGVIEEEESARFIRQLEHDRLALLYPDATIPPRREPASVVTRPPVERKEPQPVTPLGRPLPRPPVRPDADRGQAYQGFGGGVEQPKERPPRPRFDPIVAPAPPPPRAWSDVVTAFMEQSNIRWGEIIGGLLIVGCSTALVVSLWNEIAQIPLLKFLLFTGVTAALFGVGFYTAHRWKLPTTSRGILTIATLLVPLNFLAIAAVSSGANTGGLAVLISELLAPAVFACLVYYAGRVLTPRWPHFLAGGVLLTSIGQLLVRHWATPGLDQGPALLLTALPVAGCCVVTGLILLRAHREVVDEAASSAIFLTLGASAFATVLPFGLLLYKTGAPLRTLMFIAPALAVMGLPLMAAGLFLWRSFTDEASPFARTAATAVAIIGGGVSLVAMLIGWPNPASVVPAAAINVACWGFLAWTFKFPRFYLLASACLSLATVVAFGVVVGRVPWTQAIDQSLLSPLVSGVTGQALTAVTVFLLLVAELFRRRGRELDSKYLSTSAAVVGIAGAAFATWFGFDRVGDPQRLSITLSMLTAAAGWLAYRRGWRAGVWVGAVLFWLALRQVMGTVVFFRFPWQTSAFVAASVFALVAVWLNFGKRRTGEERSPALGELFGGPLKWSALALSWGAVAMMLQGRRWETTAMIDSRIFWLAAIWLAVISVIRSRFMFIAMQSALSAGLALAIKLALQNTEWYAYLPNAFLHPWSLQLQGAAIVVMGMVWLVLRAAVPNQNADSAESRWPTLRYYLHGSRFAFDRILTVGVGVAFFVLAIYGALPGVVIELSWPGAPLGIDDLAGFPHAAVFGVGAWLLGGLLLIAFLANGLIERRPGFLLGALALVFAGAPLLAARWESAGATASAWRWLAAGLLLVSSAAVWQRRRISAALAPWGINPDRLEGWGTPVRLALLMLGAAPALLFTLVALNGVLVGQPVGGPSAGVFYAIGPTVSYAIPLILVVIALMGHAVRERSNGYAFEAGLLTVFTVTASHLIAVQAAGFEPDRVTVIQIFQLVALSTSAFALLWLATLKRWASDDERSRALGSRLIGILLWLSGVAFAGYLVPIALWLYWRPHWAGPATAEAGGVRSWIAWVLAVAASWGWALLFKRRLSGWAVFASAMSLAAIVAFAASRSSGPLAFHVLQIGTTGVAGIMLFAHWLLPTTRFGSRAKPGWERLADFLPPVTEHWREITTLALGFGVTLSMFMSIRVLLSSTWWAVGPLMACAFLVLTFYAITGQRKSVYAAWWLTLLAGNFWFFTKLPSPLFYSSDRMTSQLSAFSEWLSVNAIGTCVIGIATILIELWRERRRSAPSDPAMPAFPQLAVFAGVALLAIVIAMGLYADANGSGLHLRTGIAWVHVASLAVLAIVSLWERRAWYARPGVYLALLGALGISLDQLNFPEHRLAWVGMTAMAGFALAASTVWATRDQWKPKLRWLRLPEQEGELIESQAWMLVFNACLIAGVVAMAFQIVTIYDQSWLRMLGAIAVAAQALTLGLLAAGKWRPFILRSALTLLATGSVLVFWALLSPGTTGTWLNRAVAMMVMMLAWLAVDSGARARLSRLDQDWANAAQWLMPILAVVGGFCLAFVLVTEVAQQVQFGQVMTGTAALATVAITMLAAIVLAVYFALTPAHDPMQLPERLRTAYVYGAEFLLVLLFLHIRLTLPQLFTGFFSQYWPLVVVAIAFAGVGVSELLRRRGLLVLAEPLERTGAFLPLMPAVAFWIVSSRVDYSTLLFAVGLLYGVLSLMRRSFGFGLMAALAGNGGLWYFLHQTGSFNIDQHPQAWFIPVALSVLVAAQINRDRFSEQQLNALRYAALSVVYVSSTADIFLNGVAESPWLPLVLAALAIMGVLCGVAFRIRVLVIMGAFFLLVAVTTMIRYAQVNFGWTWLWYVAGIVAGGLILLTFALFEKRRRELAEDAG